MNEIKAEEKKVLIEQFIDRYLPREEIIHRLPLSLPITKFWPELQEERKKMSIELPLLSQNGTPFWFVINKTIENQCDAIAQYAREDFLFDGTVFETMANDAVLDEAVCSSIIEGAFTSKKEAAVLIRGNRDPKNKSEQMVRNNYDALTYVLEHLEESITEEMILKIAKIVTRSAAEVQVTGYRTNQVYVSGQNGPVYTPPEASKVPGMMRMLIDFIQNNELHPVLKACIAHFYFVYIHPFGDGNGRTARALSLMMLLQSGYDFFRYFSISDIVAKERSKYYHAMHNVENSDNDMTYFIDCYSSMLARTIRRMEDHLFRHVFADHIVSRLSTEGKLNERQLKGAKWLMETGQSGITVETWKKKYKVATETARRDLLLLCECGVLSRTTEGRKAVFRINNDFLRKQS